MFPVLSLTLHSLWLECFYVCQGFTQLVVQEICFELSTRLHLLKNLGAQSTTYVEVFTEFIILSTIFMRAISVKNT